MINRVINKLKVIGLYMTSASKRALLNVKREELTYLQSAAIFSLYDTVKQVEKQRIPGLFIEAGCALGGSAIIVAKAKDMSRPFRIYDAFGMIPPPSKHDGEEVHARYEEIKNGTSKGIGGNTYYGYNDDLLATVKANLSRHGFPIEHHRIDLVKGYFEETMKVDEAVAFAHIDCDWYESVRICTEEIAPKLSLGGKMVYDDYFDWSGCQMAVDEYFENRKDTFQVETVNKKIHVTRIK